ncbi:MAG: hypothetical protein HQK49_03575 [Oligoflexia bacterium]|nr:hypothetical protein [Oligoflexia bacterium]
MRRNDKNKIEQTQTARPKVMVKVSEKISNNRVTIYLIIFLLSCFIVSALSILIRNAHANTSEKLVAILDIKYSYLLDKNEDRHMKFIAKENDNKNDNKNDNDDRFSEKFRKQNKNYGNVNSENSSPLKNANRKISSIRE